MVFIALLIWAGVLALLTKAGLATKHYLTFVMGALVIALFAFMLKGKISCPFSKICPFSMCPLHKKK